MTTHAPFGDATPFAEPAWYRGVPTAFYKSHHAAFRAKCRSWVETHLQPFADEWDEKGHVPIEELRVKAAAAGLWCPWAPKEYGGTPPEGERKGETVWDEFMMLIWTDELSRCGSAGVAILFFITYMSLPHILHFGNAQQIEEIAKPIIQGKAGMAITLTEPTGGSDLAGIRTTATKVKLGGREYYRVNGQKKFITGGLCVDYFSTLVRTVPDDKAPPTRGHNNLSILVIPRKLKGYNCMIFGVLFSFFFSQKESMSAKLPRVAGGPGMVFFFSSSFFLLLVGSHTSLETRLLLTLRTSWCP